MKPKSGSAPRKTSADRDTIRLEGRAKIECHMKEIMKLFSSSGFNDSDRQQIRQQNQPCMDGFIAEDGKLRFKPPGLADKGATTS